MKKLIFSLAALAALVSCSQKTVETPSLFREVSIVANSTQTKTQLSDNAVVWEENDAIALKFTGTNVTTHVATFSTSDNGATVRFTGKLPNTVSTAEGYTSVGYAVYPATAMKDDGTVSFTVSGTPTASASFAINENLSSAVVSLADLDADGSAEATFKNALSIIRFTVDPDVQNIKLTASQPLAGTATLTFDNEGRLTSPVLTTPANTLVVNPPAGGFSEGETYNVLVYPGKFNTITAEMTDSDGCTYEKTNNSIVFGASKFYTFNFEDPANFDKGYYFTASGRSFAAGDEVQVVVDGHVNATLAYADNKFAGQTKHSYYAADKAGYALYPASAYNNGAISYNLPADGTMPTAELWAAPFSLKDQSVTFASVTASLGTVNFTVPTGVKSVEITSDKGIVGTADMTVGTDGTFTATGAAGQKITVANAADTYDIYVYVYPVSDATLTVTLKDAAGQTVTLDSITLSVAAGESKTLDLSNDLKFDKIGNFSHEGFENDDSYEF